MSSSEKQASQDQGPPSAKLLTVLPIFSSDSPYRTALSNIVWANFRFFRSLFQPDRVSSLDEESTIAERSPLGRKRRPTMVETMMRDAVQNSRDERDARAIVWTVQSLTDDNELEPFVEVLPDLIWGPTGRRSGHDNMIKRLLETRDLRLIPRIEGLLHSCDTGVLPNERETRRRISCLAALIIFTPQSFPVFNPKFLESQLNSKATAPAILVRSSKRFNEKRKPGDISNSVGLSQSYTDKYLVQSKLRNTFITIVNQYRGNLHAHRDPHNIDRIVDVLLHVLAVNPEYVDPELTRSFGRNIPRPKIGTM
ncbi:hypothetical protein C8R44DRAFT_747511 [Mycena epipterygia]|nr:hypothetical protein C8R44DRAFT_747511 [Mycena epipterygia]